jgi:OFA family oxalate/formate antiporter-like MFS transporter
MIANAATAPSEVPSNSFRWMQLIIGVICMAMIANLQYGWTYFVAPMAKANSWDVASIQVAFSIFVALETWLTPLEGWIVDSLGPRGPRLMVAAGGVFVGSSMPRLDRWRCSISAPSYPASAPAPSMPPASAMP